MRTKRFFEIETEKYVDRFGRDSLPRRVGRAGHFQKSMLTDKLVSDSLHLSTVDAVVV